MTSQNAEFFKLSAVLDYYCRVRKMSEDRILSIEVFKTNVGGRRFIIQFEDVLAVKMPITWLGPVFEIGSEVELLEMISKLNDDRVSYLSKSDVCDRYSLYKFRNLEVSNAEEMYILAGQVSVKEKIRKAKNLPKN